MLASYANAQQRYIGQWDVALHGGVSSTTGYFGDISAEKFLDYKSSLAISATYINSSYIASDRYNFDVQQYLVGCRYLYSFNLSRTIYFSLGVGGILGYENPPTRTVENKLLKYPSKFNMGIDFIPQLELVLYKNLSFVVQPRAMYLFTTNFENFIFTGGVGLKLYL